MQRSPLLLFQLLSRFLLFRNMASKSDSSSSGEDSSELEYVKILVLGEAGVGKTTFIQSHFSAVVSPIEEEDFEILDKYVMYSFRMTYEGHKVDVGLIDINSSEGRRAYPTNVNAIFLTYSIGHYSTLKSVYNLWIPEVRSRFGELVPVFLVGLKSDMRLVNPAILACSVHERNRVVQKNEAEVIHKNYHFYGDYMECSMYDRVSIAQVIQMAFITVMED